jgi:nucleotide-binding universal stress UspA family protein
MPTRDTDAPLIVVGHDGTEAAGRVVDWTAAVAAARGGVRVELVHAVALPPIPRHDFDLDVRALLDRHEQEALRTLAGAERELVARGLAARVVVRRWLPAETLLEHAREAGARLLVVGQHSRRAGRLLLGSTSSEVARDAEEPVVVVRGERGAVPPRRVLLAADGSRESLRAAAAVADWFPDAHVLAVHLREPDGAVELGELTAGLAAAGLAGDRIELRVSDGPAARALLALAADEAIDLVAAGRRGRGGWRERVLGGVAEKLLQLAPCPVLVAH